MCVSFLIPATWFVVVMATPSQLISRPIVVTSPDSSIIHFLPGFLLSLCVVNVFKNVSAASGSEGPWADCDNVNCYDPVSKLW